MARKPTYKELEQRIRELEEESAKRKRAEEALRENEAIFSAFLEHSPVYVFFKDRNMRSLRLSKNYEQMLGMPLHQALGKSMDELFPSDLSRSMVADDLRVLYEGHRVDVVEELGGRIYETTKFPVLKDGTPFILAGFTVDVTERTRAEEALRQQRETFYEILQNDPHGIALINKEGKYLYVNPQFTETTGYTLQDVPTGKEWFHKAYPDLEYRKTVIEAWKRESTREGRGNDFEFKITCKDGSVKEIEFRTTYLKDNSISVLTDVTQRKRVEGKVKNSLSLLEATLESTADGILVADGKGKMVRFNRKFVEMWNLPMEISASGDDEAALNFVLAQLKEPDLFLRKVGELYRSPEASSFDVLEFKDGRVFERYSQPQRVGESVIGRVWSFRDVTERKRAEEKLQESDERSRRAAEVNRSMAEIGRIVSSTLRIGDVYEQFAAEVHRIIPFDRIAIGIINHEQGTYRFAYTSGLEIPERQKGKTVPLPGIIRELIRKRSVFSLHAEDEKEFVEDYPEFLLPFLAGVRSIMAAPLISKDQVIGVLYLASLNSKAYTERDLKLAENVATQIAGAVAGAQLYAQIKQAEELVRESEREAKLLAQENAIIAEIGSIINSSLDIEEVYERFAEEVQELIPLDRISIDIVNLKDNTISIAYVTGLDTPGRQKGCVLSLTGALGGYVVSTRKSLLIRAEEMKDYAERFPGLSPSLQAGFRSVMSIPLISKDEVIGIIYFRSTNPDIYSEKELRLAERVGYQITSAIANSQLFAEHKRAEEDLRASEERYRDLYDEAPVGYHEVDTQGRITSVNRQEMQMLGYSAEEMLGQPIWNFIVDKEARNAQEIIRAKLAGLMPPSKGLERTYRRKDGTSVPVLVDDRFLADDDGRIMGVRTTIRDNTERKKAEEEKEKLQDQLQRAQKMEAIGTLAGGVAHDLNNILSGIVSYPDLLLMQLPEDSPLHKPLATIRESGNRAAAIVQDLLTLARRAVPTSEVVNLNDVISEYLKSPEHEKLLSFHPHVQLETDLDTDLLNMLGSPVHLSKTAMNIVSNAAEAMPEGGKIVVSTGNRYVDSPVRGYDHIEEGDYVTLSVSDTGVGISVGDRERIFEPFYTKKVMGRSGTGLGMAVVWGTVKDHKGYIDIQSAEGRGTVFTLYFPATRKVLVKDKPSFSMEQYKGKGESILVVDDVENQREIVCALLSHLGYSVAAVSSGEEAIEYVKSATVDLLVLDMIMDPGIDGLETYKKILEKHPNQKALIASGFSETAHVKEAQRLGAGEYIRKPYTLEKMGMAVRKELDR